MEQALKEFQGYHRFRNDEGQEYGSFEVFHQDETCFTSEGQLGVGWYWWACHPGCIPDGEPNGPFPTSEGAYLDALEGNVDTATIDGLPDHGDWAIPAGGAV